MWDEAALQHGFLLPVVVQLLHQLLLALQLQDVVDRHLLQVLAGLRRVILTLEHEYSAKNSMQN